MATELRPPLDERLRRGDATALSEYLELRRAELIAFIARRLGDLLRRRVEPEDIFQETATAAWRGLAAADLSRRDPFGWLCQLAEQRIVDAYRTHVRSQKRSTIREVRVRDSGSSSSRFSFSQLLQASLTTPSQACIRDEQQARLFEVLATLPDEQQAALRMHFLEGLPSKEIARRLNKEDVAVRVMISRAVQKLRRLWDAVEPVRATADS
jgi:RNA polymerase sigma-70 factor, ECF subfamily